MLLKDKTHLVSLNDLAGATKLLHIIVVLLTLVAEDGIPIHDVVLAQLKLTNSKTIVIVTDPHVQKLKHLGCSKFEVREDEAVKYAPFLALVEGASPNNAISTSMLHERHRLVAIRAPETSILDDPVVRKEFQHITVVHHKDLTQINSL